MSEHVQKRRLSLGSHSQRRVALAVTLSVLLSGIVASRVDAQSTWDGTVAVSPSTLTVKEGESVSYRVRLTKPPTEDADSNWWVMMRADGIYKSIHWVPSIGREFNPDSQSGCAGCWDQWQDIRIYADQDDDTEDLWVTFTHEVWDHNADCPVHGVGEVTVHVIDDDGGGTTPELSIGDAAVEEGDTAQFPVTLSPASSQQVTVAYATSNGTATAGTDYTTQHGTLIFTAGEKTKTISVPTTDDTVDESDKTFTVDLSAATGGATISDGTGTGTIIDDDNPAVTVSYRPTTDTVVEGETVMVTVVLSADPEREVVIPITVETGSTATTADYSGVPTSVTFASGETTKTFTVMATEDTADEPNETVNLGFGTLPTGVSEGSAPDAVVTITDDGEPTPPAPVPPVPVPAPPLLGQWLLALVLLASGAARCRSTETL